MNSDAPLVNRVANSGLITIKLEDLYPAEEISVFDIKDYLFQGLILKERDFREALKAIEWSKFTGHLLAVFCSTEAIIPVWAYMLVAAHAAPYAADVYFGSEKEMLRNYYSKKIEKLDLKPYIGSRLVIKGCSEKPVPESAYLEITKRFQPVAASIMYGEPCSTVPVYKKPKG